MEKLKIGIIGIGTMGQMHAEVFANLPYTEVNALADLDLEKAKKVCQRIGMDAECYQDYEKMLVESKIDAVAIALPDSLHTKPVIAALQAGKHVLVEKPLLGLIYAGSCQEAVDQALVRYKGNARIYAFPGYTFTELIIEEYPTIADYHGKG